MAVERAKVLTAIEQKLKGKSLSKNFKENIASKWADKIETDEDIDSYIEDREDILIEASSEADRRATEAANKAKQGQEPGKSEPDKSTTEPAAGASKEPESEIAKLTQLVSTLAQTVNSLQSEKQAESVQTKTLNDERLKNIPKSFIKSIPLPTKEEDIDGWITSTTSNYQEVAKELKLKDFGKDTPPGSQGKPSEKVASEAEVAAVNL